MCHYVEVGVVTVDVIVYLLAYGRTPEVTPVWTDPHLTYSVHINTYLSSAEVKLLQKT